MAIDTERTTDLLTAIAACIGIIGAGMLYYFVPAESNYETHGVMGLEDANVNAETGKTYGVERAELKAKWLRYVKWSRVGFGVVVVGFLIQLIASAAHAFGPRGPNSLSQWRAPWRGTAWDNPNSIRVALARGQCWPLLAKGDVPTPRSVCSDYPFLYPFLPAKYDLNVGEFRHRRPDSPMNFGNLL